MLLQIVVCVVYIHLMRAICLFQGVPVPSDTFYSHPMLSSGGSGVSGGGSFIAHDRVADILHPTAEAVNVVAAWALEVLRCQRPWLTLLVAVAALALASVGALVTATTMYVHHTFDQKRAHMCT